MKDGVPIYAASGDSNGACAATCEQSKRPCDANHDESRKPKAIRTVFDGPEPHGSHDQPDEQEDGEAAVHEVHNNWLL